MWIKIYKQKEAGLISLVDRGHGFMITFANNYGGLKTFLTCKVYPLSVEVAIPIVCLGRIFSFS